ncbi:hypothetical protein AK88_04297 [Plasmodium fragile]|uniref:Schizont-infected cell agglutination C-terminal domain-containing protein n=1 Tax=Plasmodium fragile TaxID=5857 RepID=A0A0D9QG48_PLAFR|nr:uncharacterized protein AK88_04297 [Plasmodium fragile]KJP86040.1 hypothetical protein AK88_04297 [Plasmodium fragile]
MSYAALGVLLAHYVLTRGLVDRPEQYKEFLRTDVTELLEEFVEYMENEDLDDLAANCLNVGYRSLSRNDILVAQKVADRLMCTLMSRALFFMNRWSPGSASADDTDPKNEPLKEHIRCAIVNVFMYILLESPCKSQMGIDNAWYTMDQLETGSPGLLTQGKCHQGVFANIQIQDFNMQQMIKNWLKSNGRVKGKIEGPRIQRICTKSLAELGVARKDANDMDDKIELQEEEKDAIRELGQQLKAIVHEVKKEVQQCEQANGACMKSIHNVSRSNPDDDVNEDQERNPDAGGTPAPNGAEEKTVPVAPPTKPEAPRAKVPEVTKDVIPEKHGPTKGTGEEGVARSDESAPAPVPPPPPEAPPPVSPPDSSAAAGGGTSVVGQGPDQGPGLGQQPPPPSPDNDATEAGAGAVTPASKDTQETGKEYVPEDDDLVNVKLRGSSGSISVVTSTTYNSGAPSQEDIERYGETADTKSPVTVPEPPPEPEPEPPAPSSAGSTATSSDTTTPSPAAATPSTGPAGAGTTSAKKDDDAGDSNPVVDGGNDDPPPLNPPKPKPNPNPDQAGSSGNNSNGGVPSFDLDKIFPKNIRIAAGGGFTPPITTPGSSTTSGATQGDYAVPDLTADVITATTPVLFFLSAVIVALLGYSLWKYFAYLGKTPRRTYRTVRDVPSPPLDEEILDHLQRGELTPPDYGYTMVRHTRPGTLPDRRPRPPCVHKRTIIELHLEVLNECEAADWEHGKHDFYGILVQAFARDLEQDEETNNNILGVSTSDHGSAGTNVSATVHPSTDSDATDSCPPNEDDPWSCMETIQFATDPCPPHDPDPWSCMHTIPLATDRAAPNDADPDPWSCMEHIQLETDTCATHACDPWSCMEKIQLATDPCAPNEHDPDPWSCMETIQLQTDPCPPNDPDPWNCMEPIPLESDPCAPNEHDPWSCMETIEFATDPCPPNAADPAPWRCMERIQLERDPCAPHDPDPWSCMENIDLDAEQNAHSHPDHVTSYCTHWIPWIDRHKHLLQQCTTQPWFSQLTSEWKQYLREHMAADEVSGNSELGEAATMQMQKLRLWKQWVAQQHALMHIYGEDEWFQHLLNNVQEETVSEKGEVSVVDQDFDVEKVMGTADMLRVQHIPRMQPLNKQPYMKKRLTAKLWILLLASVIEKCEIESSMHDRELYVDALLEQL